MNVLTELLQWAGPLPPGFSITISNPPWPDLMIRDAQRRGPHGLPSISVAHRGGKPRQTVGAPEMLFEFESPSKRTILTPYCFRADTMAAEEHSVYWKKNRLCVNVDLQAEHMGFLRQWNRRLEEQGYLAAFQQVSFLQRLREAFEAEISTGSAWQPEQLTQVLDHVVAATLSGDFPATGEPKP